MVGDGIRCSMEESEVRNQSQQQRERVSGSENRRWLTKQATVQRGFQTGLERRKCKKKEDENKEDEEEGKEKRTRKGGRTKREPGLAYCRDVDYIW